jgi:hypothetical protein
LRAFHGRTYEQGDAYRVNSVNPFSNRSTSAA